MGMRQSEKRGAGRWTLGASGWRLSGEFLAGLDSGLRGNDVGGRLRENNVAAQLISNVYAWTQMAYAPSSNALRQGPTKTSAQHPTTNNQRPAPSAQRLFSAQCPAPSVPHPRQGILLLVVLGMLTLFLMLGTAYLVSSSHYRKLNKTMARVTEADYLNFDHSDLLDEVINQLVRDTNNENSSLRFHSLLRDMYGNDGVEIGPSTNPVIRFVNRATFPDAGTRFDAASILDQQMDNNPGATPSGVQSQFFWVAVEEIIPDLNTSTTPPVLQAVDNYYNGNVLTLLDGDLKNVTARIVRYEYELIQAPTSTADGRALAVFKLLALNPKQQITSTNLTANATVGPATSALINGRPFNGTGAGYNRLTTSGAKLNALERVPDSAGGLIDRQLVLLPNAPYLSATNIRDPEFLFTAQEMLAYSALAPADQDESRKVQLAKLGFSGLGGCDESYDAVDFQNMALALQPVDPTETVLFGQAKDWPDTPTDWPLPPLISALPDLGNIVLPSFHRPALINYWNEDPTVSLASEPNLIRKTILRPSWFDHPNFTGTNPEHAGIVSNFRAALVAGDAAKIEKYSDQMLARMIYGPWDVDNDNDGVRDSVWVDFGAQVMALPDGRLVKPLAALLVLDLDGRLNLNAHGSLDLAGITAAPPSQNVAGNTTDLLPRGEGYGPADISLEPVVGDRFQYLLGGASILGGAALGGDNPQRYVFFPHAQSVGDPKYDRAWLGRYGSNPVNRPGIADFFDIPAQLKMQGIPASFNSTSGFDPLRDYGTPPDLKCRYALPGLNELGQPIYEAIKDSEQLDQDSPYEINLSINNFSGDDPTSNDTIFSLAEFERLLRAYDSDAGTLPARLWKLAGECKLDTSSFTPQSTPVPSEVAKWRTLLTSDSFDLPVPNVVVPKWMEETGVDGVAGFGNDTFIEVMDRPAVNLAFVDLLEYRVRVGLANTLGGLPKDAPTTHATEFRQAMAVLLPSDLANGLRMDINRPIGNGRDDNDNGVVDEPGEWKDTNGNGSFDPGESDLPYWQLRNAAGNPYTASPEGTFNAAATGRIRDARDRDGDGAITTDPERGVGDVNGDGTTDQNDMVFLHNLRRQDLARDLFVLAMTLVDPYDLTTDAGKAKTRKIAQWAINTVDFRDPDNCLTAFEYDDNPFDGWDVDGNLANDDGGLPERAIVWGAERSELLITETLAWHDRRTEDTRSEGELSSLEPGDGTQPSDVGSGPNPSADRDTSYDQRERPQGAAFIELYNPWPANPAASADIHDRHTSPGNDLGVDLARTHDDAPGNVDPSTGWPVWRLTIFKNGGFGKNPEDPEVNNRPTNHAGVNKAHRSIYFVGRDPFSALNPLHDDDGVAYFNDLETSLDPETHPVPPVRPGRYLVIGAGEKQPSGTEYLAKFGEIEGTRNGSTRGILLHPQAAADAGDRCIALQRATGDYIVDQAGFEISAPSETDATGIINDVPGDIEQFTASVAIIDQCFDAAAGLPKDCRFSVSEPAGGYPDRVIVESLHRARTTASAWDSTQNRYVPTIDVPLDDQRLIVGGGGAIGGAPARASQLQDNETRLSLPTDDSSEHERTIPGFSWVYLQRLANPMLPWNPLPSDPRYDSNLEINPYLTIDSMGVNVTVFNGLSRSEERLDPANRAGTPMRFANTHSRKTFASLQRGRKNDYRRAAINLHEDRLNRLVQDQDRVRLGRSLTELDPSTPATVVANLWTMENTAIYAGNKAGLTGNGTDNGDTTHVFTGIPDNTLGFVNEPFRGTTGDAVRDRLVPEQPFPWLHWGNRPLISASELTQVPAFPSSLLLQTFSMGGGAESYDGVTTELSRQQRLEVDSAHGHLMNFFRHDDSGGTAGVAGLHRIFEYLHVPSRFVGTETWLNPNIFGVDLPLGSSVDVPRVGLQPPFNYISSYRDPGKINLNTIVDEAVWLGVLGAIDTDNDGIFDVEHNGPTFDEFVESRKNLAWGGALLVFDLTTPLPSFFTEPFRAADAGNLVPLLGMTEEGVDCTVLREATAVGQPLFAATDTTPYSNSIRNSYFRYQPITRLGNLATTRSNVFAVWVTIGFFEVENARVNRDDFANANGFGTSATPESNVLYDRVYPEGYALGKEAGLDTGDVQRLRMFAVIDRSIPVAFESGKDHNVERAIRIRRRIE